MANESSVDGTVTFNLDTTNDPTVLTELVKMTHEDWYYCSLDVSDMYPDDIILQPGVEYAFSSTGRWTFHNSTSHFFESIQDEALAQRVEGMEIEFEYSDIEMGLEHLETGYISIKAVRNSEGKLETEITEENLINYDFNSDSILELGHADKAFDTFTEFGIKNMKQYLTEYFINNDDDNHYPILKELALNMDKLSTKEWMEVFKESEMDAYVTDWVDESIFVDLFIDSEIISHPNVSKLVPDSTSPQPYVE